MKVVFVVVEGGAKEKQALTLPYFRKTRTTPKVRYSTVVGFKAQSPETDCIYRVLSICMYICITY